MNVALALLTLLAAAAPAGAVSPVGFQDLEWSDARSGGRPMVMAVFYPAEAIPPSVKPFQVPFATGFDVYRDAEIAFDGTKLPLVMLSHGRGGNRFNLA